MGTPVRISLQGAEGRLGRLIVEEMGRVSETHAIVYAGPVLRHGVLPQCDVVVDVSAAKGTTALLERLEGQALVVGTTGDLPMDALSAYAARAPVAIVPNFSVGIPMLLDLLEQAIRCLPDGWQVEVMETHHVHKKDAPSGTAKRLAASIRKQMGVDAIPVRSLRVGETFGEHTVQLTGPGERLELKHVATGREVFAIGAVRWARWLVQQPVGLIQP